ncbi:MAG TPA: hypothetical protein VFJ76_06815 [Solirubrobacterales bacterium]|nr:hypothetical protein [Solirubrobacterales bacterium]
MRKSGSSTILELITKEAADALKSGDMESRDDRVLVRRPLWADDQGAKEIEDIMVRADKEIADVDQKSLERRQKSAEPPIRLLTVLLAFPAAKRGGSDSP